MASDSNGGPTTIPGDEKERCWIEEVFLVKEGDAEPLFTWGNDPLTNG